MGLNDTLKDIERSFGAGSIVLLGDAPVVPVDVISTGAMTLDIALGVGGLARGRIVEIYGPESSGKTTVVQHVLANAQALGLRCALIDAEHALDPTYAQATGIDVDSLLVSQPSSGEEALEIAGRLVASGDLGVIAIDSVAALTPQAEIDGEMGQAGVGTQARLMSRAMRKLAAPAARNKTLILFTNQIREKVGVLFGSPETQPGGRALKFYSTQRVDIRRIETLKDGTEAVGNRVRAKVVKNKVAAPFKVAEFDIVFGSGINASGCLLDVAVEQGIVKKSSAGHYSCDLLGKIHGRPKTLQALEDPELFTALDGLVREEVGL